MVVGSWDRGRDLRDRGPSAQHAKGRGDRERGRREREERKVGSVGVWLGFRDLGVGFKIGFRLGSWG